MSHPHLPFYESPQADHDSITTLSSNATAPNLPGAGRTVGRALDWLGIRLETFMNQQAAIYLDVGPEAIAKEIRLLRRIQEASPLTVQLSRTDARRLKKLCRRLLKYAGSTVLSVQQSAANEIMDFAVDDPDLHNFLTTSFACSRTGPTLFEDGSPDQLTSVDSKCSRWSKSSTIWPGKWMKAKQSSTSSSEDTTLGEGELTKLPDTNSNLEIHSSESRPTFIVQKLMTKIKRAR